MLTGRHCTGAARRPVHLSSGFSHHQRVFSFHLFLFSLTLCLLLSSDLLLWRSPRLLFSPYTKRKHLSITLWLMHLPRDDYPLSLSLYLAAILPLIFNHPTMFYHRPLPFFLFRFPVSFASAQKTTTNPPWLDFFFFFFMMYEKPSLSLSLSPWPVMKASGWAGLTFDLWHSSVSYPLICDVHYLLYYFSSPPFFFHSIFFQLRG